MSIVPVVLVFPFVVSLVPLKKSRKLPLDQCTLPEIYEIQEEKKPKQRTKETEAKVNFRVNTFLVCFALAFYLKKLK